MTDTAEKTRETRLRRMAKRQGLTLRKSPRRDPRAYDYGSYILVDLDNNVVVGGVDGFFQHGPDLDEIERALMGGGDR
ncbi:MAG: hypothetical protein H0T69_00280 [Thermoleophilaceae bacterium]|nr:hypothetical protein [Thermoleophilaceae bacterium]